MLLLREELPYSPRFVPSAFFIRNTSSRTFCYTKQHERRMLTLWIYFWLLHFLANDTSLRPPQRKDNKQFATLSIAFICSHLVGLSSSIFWCFVLFSTLLSKITSDLWRGEMKSERKSMSGIKPPPRNASVAGSSSGQLALFSKRVIRRSRHAWRSLLQAALLSSISWCVRAIPASFSVMHLACCSKQESATFC